MLRFFFSILSIFLFSSGLNAQTDAQTTERLTLQQLSPADADLLKETNEVAKFTRKLTALKTAFAAQNMSQIVANEAYLIQSMREETDQMATKAMTEAAQAELTKTATSIIPNQIRLEKMTNTMAAFERHTFDPAKPEAAAKDFARLDAFLSIMQEELAELQKRKE